MISFILGDQTWFCNVDGHFETDIPDRTRCVEEWIDDIAQKVYMHQERNGGPISDFKEPFVDVIQCLNYFVLVK